MSKQITVKYKKGKDNFEILCKGGTVAPYREGKLGIDKVLVAEEIFKNTSKFQKSKSSELKKTFGTDDKMECIKRILLEGTFPLTKAEINEKIKQKHDEIVNYIHKYYHDATKDPVIPHPETRIISVLKEMKVKIDPHSAASIQLKPIIKNLPDFIRVKPVGVPPLINDGQGPDRNDGRDNRRGKGRGKGKNRF